MVDPAGAARPRVVPAPGPRLIDVPATRFGECLEVLHAGFGTEIADYGITAVNTPTNPAFWDDTVIPALIARGFQFFALEEAGHIVGCAFVGASRGHPGAWVLRHLAVHPGARHHGFGEVLVTEASRRALIGGARALRIGIVAENSRLGSWYVRLGFVPTETGISYPGLPFTVDHLELAL